MLKKGEHIKGTPAELQVLLDQDAQAEIFFESLSDMNSQSKISYESPKHHETFNY